MLNPNRSWDRDVSKAVQAQRVTIEQERLGGRGGLDGKNDRMVARSEEKRKSKGSGGESGVK